MNEQEQLKESASVFGRLIGNEKGGEAAARGREPKAVSRPPAATGVVGKDRRATEAFIARAVDEAMSPVRQAIEPLKLRESEEARKETARVFSRLLGSQAAGEAAARRGKDKLL